MGKFKCYDIVESVTDEATSQFHGLKESSERKNALKSVCEYIDTLMDSMEADSFSVDINPETTEISLIVSCPEFIVEERQHPLLEVLKRSSEFCVKQCPDFEENIELQFRLPGIWYAR